MKKLIRQFFNALGYQLVKNHEMPDAWFQYRTFEMSPEDDVLRLFMKKSEDHQVIFLMGMSDFTLRFYEALKQAGKNPQHIEIVVNPEFASNVNAGLSTITLEEAFTRTADIWVVCDFEHGYLYYKAVRDHGIENILFKSLFHRSPWQLDDFYAGFADKLKGMPETMLDNARILTLAECARHSAQLPGDIVEIGSYRGGSSYVICQALLASGAEKQITLIDWYREQSDGVTVESVRKTFEDFKNVEILSGKAEEIVPGLPQTPLSFVHFDINVDDVMLEEVLPSLYQRLVPGGLLLFDNYYFRYFSKYNIDVFAQRVGGKAILMPSISQGLLIKTEPNKLSA